MKNLFLRIVFASNLLLFINFLSQAQSNKIETGNFFVTNYSRSFLNSVSGNWSLLQDTDGVIYIGNTAEGILIYDGQKIRRVYDKQGLPKMGLTRALVMDSKKNNLYHNRRRIWLPRKKQIWRKCFLFFVR